MAIAATILIAPLPSEAATIQVAPGQSVRDAVGAAQSGDTVVLGQGTYSVSALIYIIDKQDLSIVGAGRGATTLLAKGVDPVFYVRNSANITISGMTLDGNSRSGGTGVVVTGWQHDVVPRAYRGPSDLLLEDVAIRDFRDVGVFVGAPGGPPLAPGSLAVPPAYLENREDYVDGSTLTMLGCAVEDNGVSGVSGTGLVFFAGTGGAISGSAINRNKLTGVFVWGSNVDIADSTLDGNVEHALEYRRYPSPKTKTGFVLRASGRLEGNEVTGSRPLPGDYLGGGMVTQGADLTLERNTFAGNAAWGISACNRSVLEMSGNTIRDNGRAGLIAQKSSRVESTGGETFSGNAYEGIVAQGSSYLSLAGATVEGNGRYGILLQKKSEGHVDASLLAGNGTSGPDFGGIAFQKGSYGSLTDSAVAGHRNGPGVAYFGGPRELFVEGCDISDNTDAAGVAFIGASSLGALSGNIFSGNRPVDVSCPGGGLPFIAGAQPLVDTTCGSAPDQYLTLDPGSSIDVVSSERVGERKFSAIASGSRPFLADRTVADDWGDDASRLLPAAARSWDLGPGSTAAGNDTQVVVFNPGTTDLTARVTFAPVGMAARTVTRLVRRGKRALVSASSVLGPGLDFTVSVTGTKAVVAEQRTLLEGYPGVPQQEAGFRWFSADGRSLAPAETIFHLANPDPDSPLTVRLRYFFSRK